MESKYDVFISYRQSDADTIFVKQKLIPYFNHCGLKTFVDYKNFRLGVPLIKEMERGVLESKFTLAILSPKYLESTFTEFENIIAEHLGLINSQRRLICAMIEQCNPRLSIQAKLWLDFTSQAKFENNIDTLVLALKENSEL